MPKIDTLLAMLHLSDPTLPIGGFSHSNGLETYVQLGIVHNAATANTFIVQMLEQNLQYTDVALLALAYREFESNQLAELIALDNRCSAVKLTKEVRQASNKLGMRLLKIFKPLLNHDLLNQYMQSIEQQHISGHYCIAFGCIAAAMNIALAEVIAAFYYNAAVGMVTNCVKLVPLSQQTGQQLLFGLHPLLHKLGMAGLHPNETLIGVCCTAFDVRSMQHEHLYSRLYMS
jgi:urease accessory protein